VAEKELNLLELPAVYMAQLGASTAQVTGSKVFQTEAQSTLPDNVPATFSDIPRPQAVPCLLTALKTCPSLTFAASIHLSTSSFTQVGTGICRQPGSPKTFRSLPNLKQSVRKGRVEDGRSFIMTAKRHALPYCGDNWFQSIELYLQIGEKDAN
jgi:hypothetical protein